MNPFVTLKRLFEGTSHVRRSPQTPPGRIEKNFMKYDLTIDARF